MREDTRLRQHQRGSCETDSSLI